MANITADSTDLLVSYGGNWDDSNQNNVSYTSAPGANAALQFSGTAFYAFGDYNNSTTSLSYILDQDDPKVIQSPRVSLYEPFLVIDNIAKGTHTVTLVLNNGSFGLGHLTWYNPGASLLQGSPIYGNSSSDGGEWGFNDGFNTTSTSSANLTFDFQGTGIAVMGRTGPDSGNFSASLDNGTSTTWNAHSNNPHSAVLYRSDGLLNGNHTLILTNLDSQLQVGQAHIFIANPNATTSTSVSSRPTSTSQSTPTTTETPSPVHSGLSKGGVAGVAIAVLLGMGLAAFAFWFWLRRRRATSVVHEKNHVKYGRMCSKCRQDITGDYRLECVKPDCPAAVDLHPECKDWNIPEHHDHEVRSVENK